MSSPVSKSGSFLQLPSIYIGFRMLCPIVLATGFLQLVNGQAGYEDALPSSVVRRDSGLNLLRDRATLLQKGLESQASTNVRFYLGGSQNAAAAPAPVALNVSVAQGSITQGYWTNANKILAEAGKSTPLPPANVLDPNAPPTTPPPTGWQKVMDDGAQPMETQLGGAVMNALVAKPTGTPPPTQFETDAQFVAQCPMVLFMNNLSIRGRGCGNQGLWIDPSPLNTRTVLRWRPIDFGLFFGVDSAITGPGTVEFSKVVQKVTWTGYYFSLVNCLGVERWSIQEEVFKIDSMGKVSSTLQSSDVTQNSAAYFMKYNVFNAAGKKVAMSNLFRTDANQVNFSTVKNGLSTGHIMAIATRVGNWQGNGWNQCMSASSPRAWDIDFLSHSNHTHSTVATVQDIRVALASAITLMAYRDETRGSDGLNTSGQSREWFLLFAGVLALCMFGIFLCNCAMVFSESGIKEKLKKTFWDTERALMPKRPLAHHAPPMHATW